MYMYISLYYTLLLPGITTFLRKKTWGNAD